MTSREMNTPIDLSYFQEKIGLLNRDIDHYARSSADLARTLVRLAITANEAAVKKELSIEWQPIETAPKDGTQFLADIGLPWPVLCGWNGAAGGWAWAEHQIDIYKGQWNEVYFQTEWATEDELKAWMPLPELPKE